MDSIWLWPLALVAFLLSWPAVRAIVARIAGGHYRAQALTAQPDRIYLVRASQPTWRHEQARDSAARQLANAGFENGGTYLVREMPELTLGLYAHSSESAYAVVYDHPRSGFWAEFVTRYEDGSIASFTTLEPMDVDVPAGSLHVAAPESSLGDLWKRMLAERPKKAMKPCNPFTAAPDFEKGYAESVAYHKQHAPAPVETDATDVEEMQQAA